MRPHTATSQRPQPVRDRNQSETATSQRPQPVRDRNQSETEGHDVDHPQTLLLREAVTDLDQARQILHWLQHDTLLEQMREAVANGTVDQTRDQMTANGVPWDQLWTIGNLAVGQPPLYQPQKHDPDDLLSRAANRLAHADFAITMAYNPDRTPATA